MNEVKNEIAPAEREEVQEAKPEHMPEADAELNFLRELRSEWEATA